MKIAFLGTPDFALPSLEMLIRNGHDICVFTQPDKPVGRKAVLTPPPVKTLALENGLRVYQFNKIKSGDGAEALKLEAPELMVTAAFGQILSKENLSTPKHGCINVHASLLPKYRGAAPIQWAIINGESVTGVTTMLTDVGLDTGDILLAEKVQIGENETAGELFDRLATLGASVLEKTIALLEKGELERTPQNAAEATKCSMIKKDDGLIDFAMSAKRVHDKVRGMNPWPIAFAMLDGVPVKIYKTRLTGEKAPGEYGECVVADSKKGLYVNAGGELIEIMELQFPNAKKLTASAALLGRPLAGKVFK